MQEDKQETKSFSSYTYSQPLSTNPPRWDTNANAISWRPGGFTYDKLPSGTYKVNIPFDGPPYLERVQFHGDKLLDLPDDPSTRVLEHIKEFWSKKQAFEELSITFKRGIMLYGPPGSGKSVTIYRLADLLENYDTVMLVCDSPSEAFVGIKLVKELEPNRKIVVVFEDIDGMIRRYGDEKLTHLLDGGTDVSNTLFLATTNYPERIPDRILKRPSRFDVLVKIDMPGDEARRFYITNIVKNLLVDLEQLIRATRGLSIAQIKEAIILIQIFDHSIEQAVNKLTKDPFTEYEEEEYEEQFSVTIDNV